MGILGRGKISTANHVAGRITVRPQLPGTGGKYPRLRYLTSILRRLAVAEHYSELFQQNAGERKNIGAKLYNCMNIGHKGEEFSVHNIFENHHHRSLVNKMREWPQGWKAQEKRMRPLVPSHGPGYGLSQVLEEGTF